MPPSLQAIRSKSKVLMISRKPRLLELLHENIKKTVQISALKDLLHIDRKFTQNFFRKVKAKKRHEIEAMSVITNQSVIDTGVDFVVDVGGGVGHLSRILGFLYNIQMVSIDSNGEYTAAAK